VKIIQRIGGFFMEEWLLTLSLSGIIAFTLYLHELPHYRSDQLIPVFLLWVLFVAVKGIEESGFLTAVAGYLERGTFLAPKLVLLTFLLSVVLSIDVTLVTLLPLLLTMQIKEKNSLILLVAFTAHAGAALTPFGTPQNLFIFSFYQVGISEFIRVIAPFSLGLFALFLTISFMIPIERQEKHAIEIQQKRDYQLGILYLLLLVLGILSVLRICPWYTGFIVLFSALLWAPETLKVDYPLLVTFILFLGLANQSKSILSHVLDHPVHIFMLSSVLSQFISNVPTTLLLHQFTPEWEALLWGTNVGGFGTLVAALANLITYRIYAAYESREASAFFLTQMVFWGFIVYAIGIGLYILDNFIF